MQDLFELKPEVLMEQSKEMRSLGSAYESLFDSVASDLQAMNGYWSELLSNNFSGKIIGAQKAFSGTLTMLHNGADTTWTVAETIRQMDADWARKIGGNSSPTPAEDIVSTLMTDERIVPKEVDVSDYCGRVSDAEYARLCDLFQKADRMVREGKTNDLHGTFIELLRSGLPENSPLHAIPADQIQVYRLDSGFAAVTISDGTDALVVFAGTDFGTLEDISADADILFGNASTQSIQANALVASLSRNHSNIVVTGHSLGGYLATSAALHNGKVSQCVAFDPPGRKDLDFQKVFNNGQISKIRTYEAIGSPVSCDALGHQGVGDVRKIHVSSEGNIANHLVKHICDALGGDAMIQMSWMDPLAEIAKANQEEAMVQ